MTPGPDRSEYAKNEEREFDPNEQHLKEVVKLYDKYLKGRYIPQDERYYG